MLRPLSATLVRELRGEYVSCVSTARDAPTNWFFVDESVSFKRILQKAREQPGTALIWKGDYEAGKEVYSRLTATQKTKPHIPKEELKAMSNKDLFDLQRQHRKQTADVRHSLLLPMNRDTFQIQLDHAPDVSQQCREALDEFLPNGSPSRRMLISFRDLQEVQSAYEVRQRGVPVPELGDDARIYPHFGVFWPARSDYRYLVKTAPLPHPGPRVAVDIGTGTGCLALILAQRGIEHVVATDIDIRAVACARDNIQRFGYSDRIQVHQSDLFPAEDLDQRASLIVFNPPWIPGNAASTVERAVFDTKDSDVLKAFLREAPRRLDDGGVIWLLISDFAELLGLRKPGELETYFEAAGLRVLDRLEAPASHPKALNKSSKTDLLLRLRKQEKVSLWRLVVR